MDVLATARIQPKQLCNLASLTQWSFFSTACVYLVSWCSREPVIAAKQLFILSVTLLIPERGSRVLRRIPSWNRGTYRAVFYVLQCTDHDYMYSPWKKRLLATHLHLRYVHEIFSYESLRERAGVHVRQCHFFLNAKVLIPMSRMCYVARSALALSMLRHLSTFLQNWRMNFTTALNVYAVELKFRSFCYAKGLQPTDQW